jgi:hypothetical protein
VRMGWGSTVVNDLDDVDDKNDGTTMTITHKKIGVQHINV